MGEPSSKRFKRGIEEEDGLCRDRDKEFRSPITSCMLPPEIWQLIFRHLALSDLVSVINASLEWRELLHNKKITILLPIVLPILMENLDVKDYLRLRQVSTQAKGIVDQTLQQYSKDPSRELNREPVWSITSGSVSSKIWSMELFDYHLFSGTEYHSLLSKYSTQGNPFLTGNVSFSANWSRVNNGEGLIRSFLNRFGDNISSLHIQMRHGESNTSALLTTLNGNLPQALRLSGRINQGFVPPVRNGSLLNLAKLESLDISGITVERQVVDESTALLFKSLFQKYGAQLKVFHVSLEIIDLPGIDVDFLNTNFPNLSSLNVDVNRRVVDKLLNVNWTLQQLFLHQEGVGEQRCTFVDLLKVINKFGPELSFLRVNHRGAVGTLEYKQLKALPKLRKLTTWLNDDTQAWLWYFLMRSCVNLEELESRMDQDVRADQVKGWLTLAKKAFDVVLKLKKIVMWLCGWRVVDRKIVLYK